MLDLSNKCILISTPEICELVQRRAFELGWSWKNGGNIIKHLDATYLSFWDDKDMTYTCSSSSIFSDELTLEDLGIQTDLKIYNNGRGRW